MRGTLCVAVGSERMLRACNASGLLSLLSFVLPYPSLNHSKQPPCAPLALHTPVTLLCRRLVPDSRQMFGSSCSGTAVVKSQDFMDYFEAQGRQIGLLDPWLSIWRQPGIHSFLGNVGCCVVVVALRSRCGVELLQIDSGAV